MALVSPPTNPEGFAKKRQTETPLPKNRWNPGALERAWDYRTPGEASLTWFLVISLVAFTSAVFLAYLLPKKDELPKMIEVDLGFDGVENEPPPLGEPDAGAGEVQPEPMPEQPEAEQQPEPEKPTEMEQPVTPPEPIPEPEPVPEPEPEVQPVPDPAPTFVVPEEKKPEPKPEAPKEKPKPVAKPKPKPAAAAPTDAQPKPAGPAGSGIAGAKAGVRGSPGGVVGGRGGGRGDFVSTPQPSYDATARERRYQGRGTFLIVYENGQILSVSALQSTGVPYLDAKTIAHVKTRYRVKAGVSGSVRLPITWQLKSITR